MPLLRNIKRVFTEVRCPRCGQKFKTEKEYLEHVKTHKEQDQKKQIEKERILIKLEIEKCKEKLKELADLYANDRIGKQSYITTTKTLENKIKELKKYQDNLLRSDFFVNESYKVEKYKGAEIKYIERPTPLWYLLPLLFGILGGIIGYVAVKNEDEEMAINLLIFGIVMFLILLIIIMAIGFHLMSLSLFGI